MHNICSKYAVNMQKICHYIDFNIENMQNICIKYAYIYASNMHAFDMHTICINMHQTCIKYASNIQKICHYIDFNIANMQIICKKYAKNLLNMQQIYAKKYAFNM